MIFKKIACRISIILLLVFTGKIAFAQHVIDQVMGVVGSKIVLKSDIEKQYMQYLAQAGGNEDEDMKCQIFDQLIMQKLMVNQAEIDSVTVTDQQVEGELDRRMRFYIHQIGSEEKLEEYFHTTIRELKEEFREVIKEQLIVQTMQSKISKDVTVTPNEVREYFNSIPPDSIPYIDAEMEIAQIVKIPQVSYEEKKAVKARLEEYREKILKGEADFAVYAALYSQDPGSAKKGGDLGFFERGQMVPEFETAAFNLKLGDISPVIETKFGFHILQLIARRGDQINVRHILLRPQYNEEEIVKAGQSLDSLSIAINKGTIKFDEAAQKFSDDETTRNSGGLIINPETNTTRLSPDKIDRSLFFEADKLDLGVASSSIMMTTDEGAQAYRIIMVKSRTKPHQANLKDDYQKIQEVAQSEKQNKVLSEWIKNKQKVTYIQINQEFSNCDILKHWSRISSSNNKSE
jgi:peptidyl-prolyl cis-trans isomerase SurA